MNYPSLKDWLIEDEQPEFLERLSNRAKASETCLTCFYPFDENRKKTKAHTFAKAIKEKLGVADTLAHYFPNGRVWKHSHWSIRSQCELCNNNYMSQLEQKILKNIDNNWENGDDFQLIGNWAAYALTLHQAAYHLQAIKDGLADDDASERISQFGFSSYFVPVQLELGRGNIQFDGICSRYPFSIRVIRYDENLGFNFVFSSLNNFDRIYIQLGSRAYLVNFDGGLSEGWRKFSLFHFDNVVFKEMIAHSDLTMAYEDFKYNWYRIKPIFHWENQTRAVENFNFIPVDSGENVNYYWSLGAKGSLNYLSQVLQHHGPKTYSFKHYFIAYLKSGYARVSDHSIGKFMELANSNGRYDDPPSAGCVEANIIYPIR